MEAQTALVGADRGVVLYTVAAVDMDDAVVVRPGDTEFYHTLRFHKAFQQAGLLPFGMLVDNKLKRFKNLAHGLQKFRLVGITFLNLGVYALEIFVGKHGLTSFKIDRSRCPFLAGYIIKHALKINKMCCKFHKVFQAGKTKIVKKP